MKKLHELPDTVYEFYYGLCRYYEDLRLTGSYVGDELTQFAVPKKYQSRIIDTVRAARALAMPYHEHDETLLFSDSRDLRMELLYRLGYYPNEANELFGFGYFRRDGSGNLGPLTLVDAYRVGPFLEIDPLLLLDQSLTNYEPSIDRSPWFRSHLVPDTSFEDLVHSWERPGNCIKTGRMLFEHLNTFVGVVLVRLEDFVEISYTVEQPTSVMDSQWDMRLYALADSLGVKGPAVYTVSALFLDRSKIRIHRLSFPRTVHPLTRFRVYTRVLSPRIEEAIFYKEGKFASIKFPRVREPRKTIAAAVHGLWNPLVMEHPEEVIHCPWKQGRIDAHT